MHIAIAMSKIAGHRAFRPKFLAEALSAFDVVNIGAIGTDVVRHPAPRARLRATRGARLPATIQARLRADSPCASFDAPASPAIVRAAS